MRRTAKWILILVLLLAAAWRFVDLERDPPLISWTGTDWSDPGLYLYPARAFLLFGDWRPAEADVLFKSPGYAWATAAWCGLLGFSYAHAVVLAVLAGFITIGGVFFIARNITSIDEPPHSPNVTGIAALVSLLLSYIWFAQQMVPRGDMESIAIAVLTALLFTQADLSRRNKNEKRARHLIFFGGLGCGLAPFMKNHQIVFTLAVLSGWTLSYFVLDREWKIFWRKGTANLAAGLLASGIVWGFWLFWLHTLGALHDLPIWLSRSFGGVSPVVTGLFTPLSMSPKLSLQSVPFAAGRFFDSNLLYRQPVETFLCLVAFCRLLLDRRRWNWPTILLLNWVFFGVMVLSFLEYNPIRFRILFLPPAVVLAACQWSDLASGIGSISGKVKKSILLGVTGSIMGYVAFQLVSNHFSPELAPSGSLLISEYLACSVFLTLLAYLAIFWLPPKTLAATLALVFFGVTIPQWIKGEQQRSHELRDMGHYIESRYPNAILSGGWAPAIGLRTNLDAYSGSPWSPAALRRVTLLIDESVNLEVADPPPLRWKKLENLELRALKHHLEVAEILR